MFISTMRGIEQSKERKKERERKCFELTMNLNVCERLHRADRVLGLTNVHVFVIGNDVANCQHGVVVDDDSVARNLSVLGSIL